MNASLEAIAFVTRLKQHVTRCLDLLRDAGDSFFDPVPQISASVARDLSAEMQGLQAEAVAAAKLNCSQPGLPRPFNGSVISEFATAVENRDFDSLRTSTSALEAEIARFELAVSGNANISPPDAIRAAYGVAASKLKPWAETEALFDPSYQLADSFFREVVPFIKQIEALLEIGQPESPVETVELSRLTSTVIDHLQLSDSQETREIFRARPVNYYCQPQPKNNAILDLQKFLTAGFEAWGPDDSLVTLKELAAYAGEEVGKKTIRTFLNNPKGPHIDEEAAGSRGGVYLYHLAIRRLREDPDPKKNRSLYKFRDKWPDRKRLLTRAAQE